MKKFLPFLADVTESLGAGNGLFDFLRHSDHGSFYNGPAYDRLDWPAAPPSSSSVFFRPLASDSSGGSSSGQPHHQAEDPVSLYTTSDSDIPIRMIGSVTPVEGDAALFPEDKESGPLVSIDDFRADARFAGIDGSGYSVAILDSGIDLNDPFFGPDSNGDGISDRIVYQYDFADNDANASDVDGHGSNVSSIAASSDSTYTGMAPGADIVALKVFSDSGDGNFGDLEKALQWVIDNADTYNIVSVNMSLGDGSNLNVPTQLYGIGDELATLASMNVIVVSSSGNDFYEFNSIQGVAYPSADPNSLSVGAVYDGNSGGWQYYSSDGSIGAIAYTTGADRITPFSQRDDELTSIFAPGAPITGAGAYSGLVTMHGTSQAAPHITGIVALAQQLAVQTLGRKLTLSEFTQLLQTSGDTIFDGDDEDDNVNNTNLAFQRVNVLALGEAILAMAGPEPRDPSYFFVAADDAVKPEGDAGATDFTFTVTRAGDLTEADSIDFTVTGSGADPASADDFVGNSLPSGTVTFEVGETSKTITIQIAGDDTVEPEERFTLTISDPPPNGQVVQASAVGVVQNDDSASTVASFAIAADDAVKAEGDAGTTAFTFTVTRSGDTSTAGTVDYAVTGGGADGADFFGGTLPNGTISFAAGETTKTITIQVAGDTTFEGDESFTVVLSNASGGAEIATGTADGTILNDDTAPPSTFLAIAADDASKAEGDAGSTDFTFTVTRSGDTSAAGSVDYAVSGGSADGADFLGGSLPAGSVSFAAGETSKTITVQVAGDTDVEGDEAFAVTLSNASAGSAITTATAAGTILNDDGPAGGPVTVLQADFDQSGDTEGFTYQDGVFGGSSLQLYASGTWESQALAVSLGGLNTSIVRSISGAWENSFTLADGAETTLSFHYNLTIGSGYEPDEFSQVLVSIDGGTPILVDQLNGDGNGGADTSTGLQSFSVDLGMLAAGTHSLAIGGYNNQKTWVDEVTHLTIDDVTVVANAGGGSPATFFAIAALDAVKAEGDAGATDFTFTVSRSGDTSAAGTVDYIVTGAADGADFLGNALPAGTVSFAAGETSKTLTLQVAGDTTFEGDESFTVTLSNASGGAEITTSSADGTILNDDAAPPASFFAIAADDAVKAEGDAGSTDFTFTVSRSGDTSAAGSVDYAVSGAVDGADFLGGALPAGTISFAAGEASKTLTLQVAGDTDLEGDEAFTVTLSNASAGAEIATPSAGGTILNDDSAPPPAPSFDIAALDAVKAEGDAGSTDFTFTVSRSGDTSAAGSVDYAVSGGVADANDFLGDALPSGTVSFAAGETSKIVTIQVAGDTDFEGDEAFVVSLSNASAGSEIATGSAAGTILNDDAQPTTAYLAIAADDAAKAEGDIGTTPFTFTVTRSGDTTATSTVHYAIGGDVDVSDFPGSSLPSGTLTFLAGETSKALVVDVAGDTFFEADETLTVTLSNASAGTAITTASAETVVLNDDPSTFFEIAALDAAKAEGDASLTAFTFTVSRVGDNSAAGSVDYAVTGGSADATDFLGGALPSGTINFAAGEASKTLSLAVAGDTDFEGDETFTVTLANASSGSAIGIASADGTILNDDPAPPAVVFSIFSTGASKDEGDSGTTPFTFTVNRYGDTSTAGTVDYAVSGGEADSNDFAGNVLPSGTLAFAAGETSKTLTLDVQGDTAIEQSESFTVVLSNPSGNAAISSSGSAIGVIINDDADSATTSFSISADEQMWAEGDAGSTAVTFTVSRNGDPTVAASIDYVVASGNADASDFTGGALPAGTLAFAPGEMTKSLSIDVAGDTVVEGHESFTVTLANPSAGGQIGHGTAAATIVNDDAATAFAIAAVDATKAEGDSGGTPFSFEVTRAGDSSAVGSVDYEVVGGGADRGDFLGATLPSGTLDFAAGETSKTLVLQIAGNTTLESDEDFIVRLSNPSPGASVSTAEAGGTIVNDDSQAPTAFFDIAADDATKAEGDAGATPFTFTVTRSGDTSAAGAVDYAVAGGTADGSDFLGGVLPAGTVGFAAGETSKTVTIDVAGDPTYEADEDFTVTLFNPSDGAAITTDSAVGTILTDEPSVLTESISINVAGAKALEGNDGATPFTFEFIRSGDFSVGEYVNYQVTADSADASDFVGGVLPSGSFYLPAGESRPVMAIEVAGDDEFEPTEHFNISFTATRPGTHISTPTGSGTILNDDPSGATTFLEVSGGDTLKLEGNAGPTAYVFDVTRSGDISSAGWADYAVLGSSSDSDPAEGSDFVGGFLPTGRIEFAAGEATQSVVFYVNGDTDVEGDEAFVVHLTDASPGSAVIEDNALGRIYSDDQPPPETSFAIAALDAVKAEGDSGATPFTFEVTRGGDVSGTDSIDYRVIGDDTNLDDFAGGAVPEGTLVFSAGETSKIISVDVQGDTDFELYESFTVKILNPSEGARAIVFDATGTIVNDDPPPATSSFAISALDAVKAEGDAGSTDFTFTVTRSGDTSAAGSVDYAVTGDTDAADFVGGLPSGTVAFAAGEASKTLVLQVSGDTSFEPDENFTVTLSNASAGSAITTASADGTILNDDVAPPASFFAIAALDAVKAEGDAGSTGFTFTVSRSGDTSAAGSVDYAMSGDADAADFVGGLPSGTVSFAAGETSKTLTIDVAGDTTFEGDEAFTVTLSNASAGSAITTPSASGTILNDDPAPPSTFFDISALDAAKPEGDAGSTDFTFTVSRSGDTSAAGSVDYAVTGDADAADFIGGLPSGTVAFAAGEVSKTLTLQVAGDTTFEGDEAFTVTLANASAGSAITTASAGGTILNDDAAPPATFFDIAALDAVKAEGDAGSTDFTFTVSRSGDTSAAGSVDYAVTGDADATDFIGGLPSGTVAFAAGEASKTLTLQVAGDTTFESDEAFTVTLSNASAGSAITTASAGGTILNDDTAPPATFFDIAALDAVKAEGDAGSTDFTFTVTRSGDLSAAGMVDYAVAGSVSGDDFVGGLVPAGAVAFAAGEASKTLTLQVAGDTTFEGDEAFTVTLSNASAGSEITTASAGGTILNDDPAPPSTFFDISALDAAKLEGDAGSTDFTFTVSRSGDTSGAGSVDYAVTGSVNGDDFLGGALPEGTISFDAGEASKTLTLLVAGDTLLEGDEAFTVALSNASAGSGITAASAAGVILNDDAPPSDAMVLVDANFDAGGDTGGFTYSDGVFGGDSLQIYASGSWSDGHLEVDLGGLDPRIVHDMSGGWETGVTLDQGMEVSLSFDYQLTISSEYEADEYSQVLVSVDGGAPVVVAALAGNGNGGADDTTGPQSVTLDLGPLEAGDHTIAIGGYNNQKTWYTEDSHISIDDVLVSGTPEAAGPSAQPASLADAGTPHDPTTAGLSETELLSTTGV